MCWKVGRMDFPVFSIQNSKSNRKIISRVIFTIIFSSWVIYSFLIMLIYKRLHCWYFFRSFSNFALNVLKVFIIFFTDKICCCFFCFLSNPGNLYFVHDSDSDLFYDICNTINERKQRKKSLHIVNVSNPAWNLQRSN